MTGEKRNGNAEKGMLSGGKGRMGLRESLSAVRERADRVWIGIRYFSGKEDEGIDGILVTVGLCIIALLLCLTMRESLSAFIEGIVESLTGTAKDILSGSRTNISGGMPH